MTLFHAFLYNGYYGQPQVGFAMWSAGVARSLSMACNGLFMTLTGYLHYGKRSLSGAVRGLGPVLLGYALAAAFSIPVRHFLLGQQESLSVWVTRFFGFRGVYYGWYVEMYIGLALLSPFLNRLLEALPDRELCLLTLVLLFLTAVPGATPMVPGPSLLGQCLSPALLCAGGCHPPLPAENTNLGRADRGLGHCRDSGDLHGAVHRRQFRRRPHLAVRGPVGSWHGGVPVPGIVPPPARKGTFQNSGLRGRGLLRGLSSFQSAGCLVLSGVPLA